MSQFAFLQSEFPEVFDDARRAEAAVLGDPRAACFYARRTLEGLVDWVYRHDDSLQLPYRDDLSALIHEETFRRAAGRDVFQKCRIIKDLGNHAVHAAKPVSVDEATGAVRELFHVAYWLVRTYGKGAKTSPTLAFDPAQLPDPDGARRQTQDELKRQNDALAAEREKLFAALAQTETLDVELKRLRKEVAAAKKANEATPDAHDYSEAQTRDLFIDLLLREAGWPLDRPEDREYEVDGMPNAQSKGYVDYVLWGGDGRPLAVVEAKRTRRDARVGGQQAKLYADCLEAKFGQRPVIFYTNGYEHWLWDDRSYPPRPVQGFFTKAELELLIQRRATRKPLGTTAIDERIVERYYQTRAIRRVGEVFEKDRSRRALLVMATGAGKTRTVIALTDLLMRANWAKRILFLADRTALVNQAVNAFKRHLPDAAPVNLVTEKHTEGRVYASTYPTMIGLIDERKGGEKRFGPGHFDLIIVDEAHRSIFLKYRAIFDYFDSLLVGLTATPKDEVERNTYRLFELEDGVPTDAYTLSEAVSDGYLVPAKSVSVPLRLPTQGITYDSLSDEEKERFELTDWKERAEDVLESGRVEPAAVNQWLFNVETVDKVLRHLMERGQKVDDGDKLGKTIVFAKNHDHAMFIAERFDKNYARYAGHFAKVIDFKTEYAQSLIDDFSNPSKFPQIAISVDMLDTGIDVPEVVNLVFFKQVRSKTKFWQMVGRGTRLCPDLFGPGQDKEFFYIFDYCGNLEFFRQEMDGSDGASGTSLGARLFAARLRLIRSLSRTKDGARIVREQIAAFGGEPSTDEEVFRSIVELLKAEVGAMNLDNFIVRAKRRLVERFQREDEWRELDEEKLTVLEEELAGLPSERPADTVEAKRFDLLMLRLQLSCLEAKPGFDRLKTQLQEIAFGLEELSSIPVVREQLTLIQELQTDGWWQDVNLPMLETVRLRLRSLIQLVEHRKGSPVFTDFSDDVGEDEMVSLPAFSRGGNEFERFREKARLFLRNHLADSSVQRLRMNLPLREEDLRRLDEILGSGELGDEGALKQASEGGLGLFVKSLVGCDREAAKSALNGVVAGSQLSASQIEFMSMIVDYLTEHGVMEAKALYESPFTDLSPLGPEGLLPEPMLKELLASLTRIRQAALVC